LDLVRDRLLRCLLLLFSSPSRPFS
jgi:hypothetical protein